MNEQWPSRCKNCIHWEQFPEHIPINHWQDIFEKRDEKVGHCDGMRMFLTSGAQWMEDETAIITPENFYCSNYGAKNPLVSVEEQERIAKGQIKHED